MELPQERASRFARDERDARRSRDARREIRTFSARQASPSDQGGTVAPHGRGRDGDAYCPQTPEPAIPAMGAD